MPPAILRPAIVPAARPPALPWLHRNRPRHVLASHFTVEATEVPVSSRLLELVLELAIGRQSIGLEGSIVGLYAVTATHVGPLDSLSFGNRDFLGRKAEVLNRHTHSLGCLRCDCRTDFAYRWGGGDACQWGG